ncbi:MAG TPA: hypothetical protein H9869_04480, partial [Candidatus Ligilactobacillus excrementipullorum]|nr:hypothetical protein [Candidatus Ligilactobacillus excrementipullorum]
MYSIDDDFNRISICEAKEELVDGKGMIHLKRIADVDENGEIQNVNSLKNHQPKQMLVPREQYGPFARIGVWDWKAMSNKRSILFKAKYRPDIKITFVNVLKNINSRQSIVSKIIDGNLPFIGKKVRDNNGNLIVLYKTLNDYKGYFINDNQLQEKKYRIKENVFELKKILISKNNLSKKIGDFGGYQLLRTVDFQPSNNEGGDLIKQTDKIIKPLLLEYLNQLLKQPKLLSATDASYLEHLVHKLTQQEFVQLVSDKMKVSQSGARQIFENFLQGADTYIEAKDLPSYAIYRMAQKSPKIQEIVWRGQNTSQVRLATQRLSKLNHEIESANVTKQTIEMEIETNKQQMNKLQEEVRHNQSLIKDVTVKTNGQLAKIHDDTTENLTNAPFIQYLDDGKKSDSHQYVSGLKAKDSIEIGSETELL